MKKSDIVVIIPAFNESEYIARVLKAMNASGFAYVVVDDGSSDRTAVIARRYCKQVLVHRVNLGKGAALKTGCEYAFSTMSAKAVIFMDSDAQHNPAELDLFLKELIGGAQIVLGVRAFDATMPWIKITGNRVASVVVAWLYGTYVPDIPSGFKAMTKWGYQRVKWQSRDYRVELEIAVKLAKKKIPFSTVPIQTIYLDFNRGFHLLDALQMGFDLISWRFTK